MKLLMPEAAHWALIASNGKSQVMKSVKEMRHSELHLPGMPVFGLVDGDQDTLTLPDYIIPWPVAMMENLLLDGEAIYRLIEPFPGICNLSSPRAVHTSLLKLANMQIDEERRLRLKGQLPQEMLTIDSTDTAAIEVAIDMATRHYRETIKKQDMLSLQKRIDDEVQAIVDAGEQLERFHGKKLLRKWYDHYFRKAGMGWHPFLIQLATNAAKTTRTANLTAKAVSRIKLYFPNKLVTLLQTCPEGEVQRAFIAECQKELDTWKLGKPSGTERESLRQRVVQYAHEHLIDEPTRTLLIRTAMEIGTP